MPLFDLSSLTRLKNGIWASVGDWRATHARDWLTLPILHELRLNLCARLLLLRQFYNRQQKLNRVAPTDCVLCAIKISSEVIKTMSFNQFHALPVKTLDWPVDYRLIIELVLEAETLTPVTEIAWNNKDSPLVEEEGKQELSVGLVLGFWDVTNHERDQLQIARSTTISEHFLDIRDVHLKTMLVLLDFLTNLCDLNVTLCSLRCLNESTNSFLINFDITEGSLPLLASCSCNPIEEDLVWGSK